MRSFPPLLEALFLFVLGRFPHRGFFGPTRALQTRRQLNNGADPAVGFNLVPARQGVHTFSLM